MLVIILTPPTASGGGEIVFAAPVLSRYVFGEPSSRTSLLLPPRMPTELSPPSKGRTVVPPVAPAEYRTSWKTSFAYVGTASTRLSLIVLLLEAEILSSKGASAVIEIVSDAVPSCSVKSTAFRSELRSSRLFSTATLKPAAVTVTEYCPGLIGGAV